MIPLEVVVVAIKMSVDRPVGVCSGCCPMVCDSEVEFLASLSNVEFLTF